MVADARAVADARQPEIENTRFADAQHHANQVDGHGCQQHLDRMEDQKQLGRNDAVYDEIAIGDARKHLWARQRHRHRIAVNAGHRLVAEPGGRLNARDDAGRTEQDEAA